MESQMWADFMCQIFESGIPQIIIYFHILSLLKSMMIQHSFNRCADRLIAITSVQLKPNP